MLGGGKLDNWGTLLHLKSSLLSSWAYLDDLCLCIADPVGLRRAHAAGDNEGTGHRVSQTAHQRAAGYREQARDSHVTVM